MKKLPKVLKKARISKEKENEKIYSLLIPYFGK